MSPQKACQFKVLCPIFAEYREYQKHMYINMYCVNHFELCARYRRRTKGEEVPANLAPNGLLLIDFR